VCFRRLHVGSPTRPPPDKSGAAGDLSTAQTASAAALVGLAGSGRMMA
jgi:hypothetical protein